MSTLKVDTITDAAGSGAPDHSNGLTLAGGSTLADYSEDLNNAVGTSGNLTGGTLDFVKIGKEVTIYVQGITWASGSGVRSSATGLVPAAFRPTEEVRTMISKDGTRIIGLNVLADGQITFVIHDWAGALETASTGQDQASSIKFIVA